MALASFFETPQSVEEMAMWSFAHQASHVDLQRVILAKKNVNIPLYALDPFRTTSEWVYQNQVQHTAMAEALGYKGYDLTSVDWQDGDSVVQWMNAHFEEHQIASQLMGLS